MNTGQLPVASGNRDLNVERVWLQGVTGCGSVVSIVDDGESLLHHVHDYSNKCILMYTGVEYTHSDLRDNYVSNKLYNVATTTQCKYDRTVNYCRTPLFNLMRWMMTMIRSPSSMETEPERLTAPTVQERLP